MLCQDSRVLVLFILVLSSPDSSGLWKKPLYLLSVLTLAGLFHFRVQVSGTSNLKHNGLSISAHGVLRSESKSMKRKRGFLDGMYANNLVEK